MAIGEHEGSWVPLEEQRRKLQLKLVDAIERPFRWLDPRVRRAFLEVPRDRHLPSSVPLAKAFSNTIVDLDRGECTREMKDKLTKAGVDLETLSAPQIAEITHLFFQATGSTASEPFLVALITQAVLPKPDESLDGKRALDIGTGMGFQAAILRAVGYEVVTIETKERLVNETREILRKAEVNGVEVICGDGKLGYPSRAPYDAIVISAAVDDETVVATLMGQLSPGGKLILPFQVGGFGKTSLIFDETTFDLAKGAIQELRVYQHNPDGNGYSWESLTPVIFSVLK